MKSSIRILALVGFALTSLLGTLLHFAYDWSGKSVYLAPFSGVNESTWEHMKLLFWPMLLFALASSRLLRDRSDFPLIALRSILLGLALIPVLFYTYNGAIGKSPDWINIAIFFVSAAIAYLYLSEKLLRAPSHSANPRLPYLALLALALAFVLFTFSPPHLAIFRDPITGTFGIGA